MANTFNEEHARAWRMLGIGTKNTPGEMYPKVTQKDFDDLKADYNAQYGYTVRIPQWDDIVHLTPDFLKTPQEISAEKKENLVRILDSPTPEWARKFGTVMTWIDDVQDTASIVIPLISLLARLAPKAFSRLIPIAGWAMLGYDILNLLNYIGRAPLSPMKAKREVCKIYRNNPFSKQARFDRMERVRNYKPGFGDLLQVLQTLDNFTGAGLSFGGIIGAITDSISGAYRYITGEPVKFTFDPPDVSNLDRLGSKGMKAAAAISSQGQVFSETLHFWTYITGSLSSMLTSGNFKDLSLTDLVVNPMDMMIPAPKPSNEYTIKAIEELGLKVEDGIGWPYNDKKLISISDYIDAVSDPSRANFQAYCKRHSKDSYGHVASIAMDSMIPQTILAMDPEGSFIVDDTEEMKVFWRMIKAPLLPKIQIARQRGQRFIDWLNDYSFFNGKTPGILEIEHQLDTLGIPFDTSYPATPQPGFEEIWPEGWTGDEVF